MRNYIISIITIVLILSNVTPCFADYGDKLDGHWGKNLVDEKFINKYFNYFVEDNYSSFKPDEAISISNFLLSLSKLSEDFSNDKVSLFREDTYDDDRGKSESLKRKDAAKYIIETLKSLKKLNLEKIKEDNFKDLNSLESNYIYPIRKAYSLGLIKGYSSDRFAPEESLSQIQAIILLGRLKDEILINSDSIPFESVEKRREYDSVNEGLKLNNEDKDYIILTFTKQFPNPGYDMDVSKIQKTNEGIYKIYIKTLKPNPDMLYTQVITYKSIIVKINKVYVEDDYNFEIADNVKDIFKPISNDK